MRTIEGTLSEMLSSAIGSMTIDKASAYRVKTYSDLMSHVANLAYLNKDYLIFFRGQGKDYKSKSGGSTFYPTIYRGDYTEVTTYHNEKLIIGLRFLTKHPDY